MLVIMLSGILQKKGSIILRTSMNQTPGLILETYTYPRVLLNLKFICFGGSSLFVYLQVPNIHQQEKAKRSFQVEHAPKRFPFLNTQPYIFGVLFTSEKIGTSIKIIISEFSLNSALVATCKITNNKKSMYVCHAL